MPDDRQRFAGQGRVGRLPKLANDRQIVGLVIGELEAAMAAYDLALTLAEGSVLRQMQEDEARWRVELAWRAVGELLK